MLPYHAKMPKKDEIEHILDSLDHLMREGFDDEPQASAKSAIHGQDAEHEPSEARVDGRQPDVLEAGVPTGPGNLTDEKPGSVEAAGENAGLIEDDAFDESAAIEDRSIDTVPGCAPVREEPHRLLLSEEMLDEELSTEQPETVSDAGEKADMQTLPTRETDPAWPKGQGNRAVSGSKYGAIRSLPDGQAMNDFIRRVSSDVTARLAEQLPLLVEESVSKRLAELGVDSSK